MKAPILICALVSLVGCPAENSKACAADSECTAGQRCRRGACGPICLDDSECGDAQVCRSGACKARPECTIDTDCATGFACTADRCQCIRDSSCGSNQSCTAGSCTTRRPCTLDADCVGQGGRCEVTQGICLPSCVTSTDCAPQLDPQVALALYACIDSACVRRCVNDVTCGGSGFLCASNLCRKADCKTLSDCAPGQYCTSANFGRCAAYSTCTDSSTCQRNWECRRFATAACPPGFDCNQQLCLELPQCLTDADCVTGIPGTGSAKQNGYCAEGHCQPTSSCVSPTECGPGKTCIAKVCVPAACRGHQECRAGQACVDGSCIDAPMPAQINVLRVTPASALLEVGDTLQLKLVAFRLDGSSFPYSEAAFTVVDQAGMASTAAAVTPQGLVTAVEAGSVVIRVKVTGSALDPVQMTLTIVPEVTTGRRLLVVDAATKAPLVGAQVFGCVDCSAPTAAITDSSGIAFFAALGAGPATFTVVSAELRPDGLPAFERASIIGATSPDVYLPLRANPVKSAAGFNASLSFSKVSTSGTYWAGLVATSIGDLPSVKPADLLGDTFRVKLDIINQKIPVPGAVVLYTSAAFGFPQEVKPRAFGFGQPGTRFVVGYAGRGELVQAFSARSIDFLGYLGAFDYGLDTGITMSPKVNVPDTADVNGNGLCTNPGVCPMGTEEVPDYASFTRVSMTPSRQQSIRTEVVFPKVPQAVATVLTSAVEIDAEAGLLPVGFASKTPGMPGSDGTRTVASVTLRSGAPYNGLEVAQPGLWSLATNTQGTGLTARVSRHAVLPTRVVVSPFLPWPTDGSYSPETRTFSPGQPVWSSVYSSGAELARVAITGTEQRHVLYFAISGTQTAVVVPRTPAGPGADPTAQAMVGLEVVTVDLANGVTPDEIWSLHGVNLSSWVTVIDGYSRFDR